MPKNRDIRTETTNRKKFPDKSQKQGNPAGILKFGKQFLISFKERTVVEGKTGSITVKVASARYESPVAIVLERKQKSNRALARVIASAKLGFEKEAVIVEALQGGYKVIGSLEQVKLKTGMPWASFLLKQVEEHARENGFKAVKLRRPETLHYYQAPFVESEDREKVMSLMNALYYSTAKGMGYRKEKEFFVKEL